MNNNYIQDISELTDSCELLEEKPKKFMAIFIYIIIALIGAAVLWACIGEIDEYVKASGVVRPDDRVSTITNTITGKVTEVNLTEGQSVKKGDVLFKVDTQTVTQSLNALNKQKQKLTVDIQNLEKYKQCIISGRNLFNKLNSSESPYYDKYEDYIASLSTISEQYQNNDLDYSKLKRDAQLSEKIAQQQLDKLSKEGSGLEELKQSIDMGKSMFTDPHSVSAQKFSDYNAALDSYNQTIQTETSTLSRMEKLYSVGGAASVEVQNAKDSLNATQLQMSKYKSEFNLSLQQSIEENNKSIDQLSATIKSAQTSFDIYYQKSNNEELAKEKQKLDTLTEISTQIETQNSNLDSANKDIKDLSLSISDAVITAPIDGTVNLYSEINQADYIQSGLTIGTIVPDSASQFKVLIYISPSDISKIKVNQQIKLRFTSLSYKEYGEFDARLTNISADTKTNSTTNTSYYTAECVLSEEKTLINKAGFDKVKAGMQCDARVITEKKKIIFWLFEKMNFMEED